MKYRSQWYMAQMWNLAFIFSAIVFAKIQQYLRTPRCSWWQRRSPVQLYIRRYRLAKCVSLHLPTRLGILCHVHGGFWSSASRYNLLRLVAVRKRRLEWFGNRCLRCFHVSAAYVYGICGAIGVTGGSHRLWAHSAYKAKLPLRCMLMIMQTIAFQNCIWEWVRDHRYANIERILFCDWINPLVFLNSRVHHKYTDTNADPHNYSRGFFFAHMGWLMVRKHPQVKIKGAGIDLSDIERDRVCVFQKK